MQHLALSYIQWVRCLPLKHKDWSLDPQKPTQSQAQYRASAIPAFLLPDWRQRCSPGAIIRDPSSNELQSMEDI